MARMPWLVVLVAVVPSLAACGGKGGGTFAKASEVSTDLLTRHTDAQRALFERDGVVYLHLRFISGYDEGGDTISLPSCWTSGDEACAKTEALSPEALAELGDVPKTLTVLADDGPCTAQVGTPVLVNTAGCDPSATVGAPLSGCSTDVAPVGRIDDSYDPELRWRSTPPFVTSPLFDDPAKLTDPVHREHVKAWLAEDELRAGAPREGRTADVKLDAGAEALESVVAGYLVGDSEDQCEWNIGSRAAVGLRRGGVLTPLDVPTEWEGAITWRGRVVGVASGAPQSVTLHAIGGDGGTTVAFEAHVWSDNDECYGGGWADVEFPCGP